MTLLAESLADGRVDGKVVLTVMGADRRPDGRRPRIQVRLEITLPANDRVRTVGVCQPHLPAGPRRARFQGKLP